MKRWLLSWLVLTAPCAGAAETGTYFDPGQTGLDLRYRFESVEQDGKPSTAGASTLRVRLRAATVDFHGFSALAELDHIEVVGTVRYDDTRNGLLDYPVVADPQGSDLNQLYLQYADPGRLRIRLGRQRISQDDERFVGSVGWRQNEQTFDAARIEVTLPGTLALDYAYVDGVQRVFGPDDGEPPAALEGTSHLMRARLGELPRGVVTLYGYRLDFDNAMPLSLDTLGLRYEGRRRLIRDLDLAWTVEYARQDEAGARTAPLDADYRRLEAGVGTAKAGVTSGIEILSGERGTFAATGNPAFQTPLATLHRFQGWADKFLTTPSAGIEDFYVGLRFTVAGWNCEAIWHDFSAMAGSQRYGSEIDLALSRRFAGRYEFLAKFADYSADGLHTDTRKLWLQVNVKY